MKSMRFGRAMALAVLLCVASAVGTLADEDSTQACGGLQGLACSQDQFCDFPSGTCGAADQMGTCMPKPQACTREYMPVCGCDGKTYGNDCDRRSAGVSKQKEGEC